MLPVIIVGENSERMNHIGKSMPMAQCVPLRSIQFNPQSDSANIPALGAPSIVLLDIESGSGAEIAQYIRRFKMAYADSAILALISFGDAAAEQAAIDSGADDVLLRPVSITRLSLTLRNLSELVTRRMSVVGAQAESGYGMIAHSHAEKVCLLNEDGSLKRLHHIEQEIIQFAVEYCHGHISNTAKLLGIGRSTLYRKLDAIQSRNRFQQRVLGRHQPKVVGIDTVM